MRRLGSIALAACLVAGFAPVARASTLTVVTTGTTAAVSFAASNGERNDVTIQPVSCSSANTDPSCRAYFQIIDEGKATMNVVSGTCLPVATHSQTCFASGRTLPPFVISVALGDGDDSALIWYDTANLRPAKDAAVTGGAGRDSINILGADKSALEGGSGDDTIAMASGNDEVEGGSGDDTILAPLTTCAPGATGKPALAGSTGKAVDGGSGNDTLSFEKQAGDCRGFTYGGLTLKLGDFDDVSRVERYRGSPGEDTITGTSDADTIDGGGGSDVVRGRKGDDNLTGYEVRGGDGDDTLKVLGSGSAYGGDGDDELFADSVGSTGSTLSDGDGDDRVVGDVGVDKVIAGKGSDSYKGGEDADSCAPGPGCTVIPGYDEISYESRSKVVKVDQDGDDDDGTSGEHDNVQGFEIVRGGDGSDTLANTSDGGELHGGDGDDTLSGKGGDDTLQGGGGIDTLKGGQGNDTLKGGKAGDTLFGGEGDDTLSGGDGPDDANGGAGSDSFLYDDHTAGVTVSLDNEDNDGNTSDQNPRLPAVSSQVQPVEPQQPTAQTPARDNLHRDIERVVGTAADDTLFGGPNADTVEGNGGNDTLAGLLGNDVLRGGEGADRIFGGPGNDQLFGEAGNDLLQGRLGDDALDGGAGDDTLAGGQGADSFTCGPGNDRAADREDSEPAGDCEA